MTFASPAAAAEQLDMGFAPAWGALVAAKATRFLAARKLLGRAINGRAYWLSEWDAPTTASLLLRRTRARRDYLRTHHHTAAEATDCLAAIRALERIISGASEASV